MTFTNTTATKSSRSTTAPTASESGSSGGVPQPMSAGRKALMVVLFIFGVWRLSIGVMTLVGPSLAPGSGAASHAVDTSSVCYSNPAARGC